MDNVERGKSSRSKDRGKKTNHGVAKALRSGDQKRSAQYYYMRPRRNEEEIINKGELVEEKRIRKKEMKIKIKGREKRQRQGESRIIFALETERG